MDLQTVSTRDRIRDLNDALRAKPQALGKLMMTSGLQAMGMEFVFAAIRRVREFADFSADNDPHGEHDFGGFELGGERCFWKIDYYDKTVEFGSEDPADPTKTTRVLTIMLAEEY